MSDNLAPLKEKYLEYYRQLPVQRLAAKKVHRDEDTIIRWKNNDAEFADKVSQAEADFALDNVRKVKNKEWVLERVLKDTFGKDIDPQTLIQINSYQQLTDEQLDKLIASKGTEVGVSSTIAGETTQNDGESPEVREATPETN